MKIIGITGSSGSGKSTICDILQQKYDVKIIDADKIAKRLSKKGTDYINDIVKEFGNDIIDDQGELNRRKLAEIIYADPKNRNKLNQCTFKYIRKEIEREIIKEKDVSAIIIDAPLLFECELDNICDHIIGVISKKDIQIERIVTRDGIDYENAEKRLKIQKNNEFYVEKCDEIIENNNDMTDIEKNVEIIARKHNITKKLR